MTTDSLYDATLRQQMYVEGVKNEYRDEFIQFEEILIATIVVLLSKYGAVKLSDLTRVEFNRFMAELSRKISPMLKAENARVYAVLREMLVATFAVSKGVYSNIVGTGPKYGTAAALWKKFQNDIVPGPGLTPRAMLGAFALAALDDIRRTIATAWADKLTADELFARLIGTKELLFRDGLMRRLKNSFNTLFNTLLQKVVNGVDHFVGRLFFDKYEWVSVLDSRTTELCRSRDGTIYTFGDGPVPPAHYNCRSRIVPIADVKPGVKPAQSIATPPPGETAAAWFARQPASVRDDLVGKRSGETNEPLNRRAKSLTIENYRNKVNKIIT